MKLDKVLVLEAPGDTGKGIAKAIAGLGHPTFALVRPASATDPAEAEVVEWLLAAGVTVLHGELGDHESLIDALKSVDVGISARGPPQLEEGQLKLLEAIKLVEAIKQVGHIKRLLPSEFGTELAERVVRQELLERVVRPELVERILAAMPRDDAIRAGLVCHQWHNVFSSSSFSKLCSRRLSACDKICFPAKFTLDYWTSGLGLDMEQQKWHKLPSLCPFNPDVCLACHKGLLCLGKYRDRGCMEYWVANPVMGAERELPSLRSLIEGDEQLAEHYSSHLSAAFLEVDEDWQSNALLGVCKRKTRWESLEAGPARIVRYRSGSSSWTLLTSRCQEAAAGTAGDADLTLCELIHCYSDGMRDGKGYCAFNGGQVFGLVRGRGREECYFLVCFHVEAMTWNVFASWRRISTDPKRW